MQLKENRLFYTPESKQELQERVDELARASDNPAAVWTAVMMALNWAAKNQKTREDIANTYGL